MSIKRLLPILIVVIVGFLTLTSHFINNDAIDTFVREDATGWYNIIAAFAVFLGSLNLIKFQSLKVIHKKKDWHYSTLTLLSFFVMIFFAFFLRGTPHSELYEDLNENGKYDFEFRYQPKWDEEEHFVDIGNGEYDRGETFIGENENNEYDIGESWIDLGNGYYDVGEEFDDISPLSPLYIEAEKFIDAGYDASGNYIYEKFCLIDKSERIIWESCIINPDWDSKYGNGIWDREIAWGSHVTYDGENTNSYDGHYPGSYIKWFYNYVYTPLSATMFALLAFFVASASYRAFRIRNFEATLLLVAGVLLMLGRVPLGNTNYIPWWIVLSIYIFGIFALIAPFFKNKKLFFISIILSFILFGLFGIIAGWNMNPPQFLQLPSIQRWIFFNPQLAAARAIKIGIALGIIATSFRIITGRERGIFGD